MKTLIRLMVVVAAISFGGSSIHTLASDPTLDLACGNPVVCGGGGGFTTWPPVQVPVLPALDLACGNPVVCGGGGG